MLRGAERSDHRGSSGTGFGSLGQATRTLSVHRGLPPSYPPPKGGNRPEFVAPSPLFRRGARGGCVPVNSETGHGVGDSLGFHPPEPPLRKGGKGSAGLVVLDLPGSGAPLIPPPKGREKIEMPFRPSGARTRGLPWVRFAPSRSVVLLPVRGDPRSAAPGAPDRRRSSQRAPGRARRRRHWAHRRETATGRSC